MIIMMLPLCTWTYIYIYRYTYVYIQICIYVIYVCMRVCLCANTTSSGDHGTHRPAAESSNHRMNVNHVGIHQKQITSTNNSKSLLCGQVYLKSCGQNHISGNIGFFFVRETWQFTLDPNTVDKENPPKQLNTANILWIAVPESSQLCTLTW